MKFAAFVREPLPEKLRTISHRYWRLRTELLYRRYFSHIGPGSKIIRPLKLSNTRGVTIGSNVLIHPYAWIQIIGVEGTTPGRINFGDGTTIGNFSHITAATNVSIGRNVLIADKVLLTDHSHNFQNPKTPIKDQGVALGNAVTVGDGSWIAENACVISARIGRNCVIGANSVVINDIPDYSVAVGSPAKVIKRYCFETNQWKRA